MTFQQWYEKNQNEKWHSFANWLKQDLQAAFRAGMKQGRKNERKRKNRKPLGYVSEDKA